MGPHRMANELRHVAAVEPVAGLNEAIAAVGTLEDSLAGGGDHDFRIIRHYRDRVRIKLDAFFYVLPTLPAILATHHPSLFDRAENNHGIIRAKRQSLDMAHVGRTREGPIDSFRQVPEPFAIKPMIAAVVTLKHRRWAGADKKLRRLGVLDDTPCFFIENTVVDLPPARAAIFAALHAASTGCGVEAPRIVPVDQHRRPQCAFALKCQGTRVVLFAIGLSQVQTIFSTDIEDTS